ncbi:phage tail assembly protein [Teredinibacter sp. KSP-S5-2]|uniref:phage tail assembly protein n=1 Tax=Teredinibacter sp. KSP-S5-2 TaxID=3034506 RepID=UPI002934F755|nr:phage tail assembly protein [Teredinibacter sp. KSP-S5-2]WNO10557.1 phage tail assembly protein [Teredinibacter sp. KSP-S5-2]
MAARTQTPVARTEVTLQFPIFFEGKEHTQILIRRPKVRDMLGVEDSTSNDAQKEIDLFANLCECSPDLITELDMLDYAKLQETYQGFLSSKRKTPVKR